MRDNAQAKQVGIGPNVKALIDILGDTMEEVIFKPIEEEEDIDWDNIDVTLADEFHDANTSQPSTPK